MSFCSRHVIHIFTVINFFGEAKLDNGQRSRIIVIVIYINFLFTFTSFMMHFQYAMIIIVKTTIVYNFSSYCQHTSVIACCYHTTY